MGGLLKDCGCYDGPYSEDCPHVFVSVRCNQHENTPALQRYALMYRDVNGKPYCVKPGVGKMKYAPVDRRGEL